MVYSQRSFITPTDYTDISDFSSSLFRCAVASQGALQMNTDFLSLRSVNRQRSTDCHPDLILI